MSSPVTTRAPGFGNALLTALLTLLLPPLGYVFLGHWRRGAAQIVALLALWALTAFGPAALFETVAGVAAYVALALVTLLGFLADALRILFTGRARRGLPFQRWWPYAGVALGLIGFGVLDAAMTEADRKTVRSYRVPSSSALPTLRPGDLFFALRLSAPPRRGDVVVYRVARDARIGRVMALGGDRIAMRNGAVVLNGVELKREAAPPFVSPAGEGLRARELPVMRETNAEGRSYLTLDLNEAGFLDTTDEVEVPPGHVFVLGDNRDNSLDSRVPNVVGFVPEAEVRRRAGAIYWSDDLGRVGAAIE
ncbi:signal peptidase I [Methylopila musalis]|uniref:Signal peptidase I n=1 Tax=Methylopila musalis TaxID=1134781 RepID=A0ABW3ZB82_9HYPH